MGVARATCAAKLALPNSIDWFLMGEPVAREWHKKLAANWSAIYCPETNDLW